VKKIAVGGGGSTVMVHVVVVDPPAQTMLALMCQLPIWIGG